MDLFDSFSHLLDLCFDPVDGIMKLIFGDHLPMEVLPCILHPLCIEVERLIFADPTCSEKYGVVVHVSAV